MKKAFLYGLSLALLIASLSACGGKSDLERAVEDAVKDHPLVKSGAIDKDEAVDEFLSSVVSDVEYTFSDGVLTASGSGYILKYDWLETVANAIYETDEAACRDAVEKVVIENGVTGIGANAFENCHCLSEVSIPDSVVSIKQEAFRNCAGWIIPDGVETYSDYWHSGMLLDADEASTYLDDTYGFYIEDWGDVLSPVGLTSIVIPDSVTEIGTRAFERCQNLESIVLPSTLDYITSGLFSYCASLTSIQIPETVSAIGDRAFESCLSLEEIIIPDSVIRIQDCAFCYCVSLSEITIPESVTSTGVNLFSGSGLTKITIPASAAKWGAKSQGGFDFYDYTILDCESLTDITFLCDIQLEDVEKALQYPFTYSLEYPYTYGIEKPLTVRAASGSVAEGYCNRQIEKGEAPFLTFIPL